MVLYNGCLLEIDIFSCKDITHFILGVVISWKT